MRERIGRRIMGLLVVLFFCGTASVWAAATLENPAPGALKSGVGLISGWVCDADMLEVSFDGGARLFVPYGSDRTDTAGVCGDADNGFGLLMNYNELGDGPHTVTLYVDGMIQTQVNFSVQTLGTNFLRGVTGQGSITLSDGKQVNVQWEETTQGFTITGYSENGEPPIGGGGDGTQSIADTKAELEKLFGTWEVTIPVFGGSILITNTYTFDSLFVSLDGIQSVEGTVDFTDVSPGPDATSTTSISRDTLDDPSSALAQYMYATYHEGYGSCYTDLFNLTSPTTFVGAAYGGIATPGGCDYYDEPPAQISGRRIQGP